MEEERSLNKQTYKRPSWLWKWVVNNQFVSVLLIILLVLINIWVFTKIAYIFQPIGSFVQIIGFPVVAAGILYYLMKPGMDLLTKHGVPKRIGVWIMLVLLVLLILAVVFSIIPILQQQIMEFIGQTPRYFEIISAQISDLMKSEFLSQLQVQLKDINMNFLQTLTERMNNILNVTFSGIGSVFGVVGNLVVGLITMPILLYYLLTDGDRILPSVSKVFPTASRAKITEVLAEMNTQISQYIRGQITVAFAVAVMFMIGYSIIGLQYGLAIAFFAGILNIIPYVGSFFGMVPAIIVGFVHSPMMLLQVLIVFVIEQTIEGRILSPLILGNSLKMHPVTILVILLTAGKMYGLTGLILGIPGYAVIKVFTTHLFAWYKDYSGLYPDVETSIQFQKPKIDENTTEVTK